MGLRTAVRRLLGRGEEQRTLSALPWDIGGMVGQRQVTPSQALSLVPVFGAVRLLAAQVASLPLQTYRKVGDGRVKVPTGSLFTQPAAHGTLYDWLHRCVTSLALRGNAYGLITARDAYGFPTMIEWLHPDHVQCQDSALSGPGSFIQPIWTWNGRLLPAENLVHIAWFTQPWKVQGLSPIEACESTISTGVSAQTYTSDWFANGAVPPGKFKNSEKTVSQSEGDEIKARLVTAIRSRKPLVYGSDWDYEPIAVSANEAKFIETMQMNATQIATIFGVPPEKIGGQAGGSLTYNTTEQDSIDFEKWSLRPWLECLEEAFSALLPRGQYVKFNVDALLRTDLAARMQAYQVARNIGLMNIDEARALEDLQPLPNGEGKDYTPLLVQVAASRGIDAAQVKSGAPLADQPLAGTRDFELPAEIAAELEFIGVGDGTSDPTIAQMLTMCRAAGADVTPGHDELHHYWTHGEGLAKWADSPKPWTTLVALLTPHVGLARAKVFASRWFIEVFGFAAGSDLNRVTHGHPPRGHKIGPG